MVSEESESALGRSSVAYPSSPYQSNGAPPPCVPEQALAHVVEAQRLVALHWCATCKSAGTFL